MRQHVVCRTASAVVLSLLAIPVFGALSVSISGSEVTASGLTPGAGAIFFSVAHEPHLAYFEIRKVAQYVADEDGDGIVAFTAAAVVPWNAVWLVVDAKNGALAAGTRDGVTDRSTSQRRTVAKKDAAGEWVQLSHERSWLELLVVRPGDAAWTLTAMRGGAADVERKGGAAFDTPVELFRGLTPQAQELKRLKKDDVVVAIDPQRVEYFVFEVE